VFTGVQGAVQKSAVAARQPCGGRQQRQNPEERNQNHGAGAVQGNKPRGNVVW